MLIIIDKKTKKIKDNLGTNSLFPAGDLPISEKENEIYVRLNDGSEFAKQILAAYDYELVLDENNEVTEVIVHKSLEEYQAEVKAEQDLLDAIQPTETDIKKAEIQLVTLETLMEVGLI